MRHLRLIGLLLILILALTACGAPAAAPAAEAPADDAAVPDNHRTEWTARAGKDTPPGQGNGRAHEGFVRRVPAIHLSAFRDDGFQ